MTSVYDRDDNNEDYEKLAKVQRLKAAIHYGVGQICDEISEEEDITFQKKFIAVLAEATFKNISTMAKDLELFAKHAKRTTINADDVKLLVRKNQSLMDHISAIDVKRTAEAAEKRSRKGGRKKKTTDTTTAMQEDN